jgi:diguanylate cyclase (GGDEF)-like protein
VRSTDLVGRYGGEEFILLLPGVSPARAREITAEISRGLQESGRGVVPRLPTVSYGIASANSGAATLQDVVAAADVALYQAKTLGRDRSVLAPGALRDKTA